MLRSLPLPLMILLLAGCAAEGPTNPSFPVSTNSAKRILQQAAADPKPLDRPLVVIGGFLDPGYAPGVLAQDMRTTTHDNRIISVSLGDCNSFDQCRQRILESVDRAFPTSDPTQTSEVDVIGYSMGGIAARYAAEDPQPGQSRRLRIVRLFTISTPHRGAYVASELPVLHPLQQSMQVDSPFIQALNSAPEKCENLYPVYAYVCLGDDEIGLSNTAPPGETPWWVSAPPTVSPHVWAFLDERIRADITRRLRDEPPLTSDPPAPIPASHRSG